MLIDLGLSPNESKLYMALLELSEGTVDEIARVAGVRRPSAYNILREMVHKGLIAELPGRPLKYRMLNPGETLKELYEKKLAEVERLIHELPKRFDQFIQEAQKKYVDGGVSIDEEGKDFVILKGFKTVTRIVQHYEAKTRSRIRGMTTRNVPSEQELDMVMEQVKENVEEGIGGPKKAKLHLIMDKSSLKAEHFRKFMEIVELMGDEVRVIDDVPIEITIYDDFAAMIALNESFDNPVVLLIKNKPLVNFMMRSFDLFWKSAKKVTLVGGGDGE